MIVILVIVAYLTIGFIVARIAQPAIIERNKYQKGDRMRSGTPEFLANPGYYHRRDGIYRRSAILNTWALIFTWPVLSLILAVNTRINKAIDAVDPAVHAAQAKRIAELEYELEIQP
jgi:hypothetical protein